MKFISHHSAIYKSRIRSYLFGFNGQEKLNELYGEGNAYGFEYRIHDPRIGRFLSVDPLSKDYPYNSPYAFCENTPIAFKELEGLEKVPANEVWDLGSGLATASSVFGNYNKNDMYIKAKIEGQIVTLHPIRSGINKGNYLGIVHNGYAGNFFKDPNDRDKDYTYEERYVVGKDIVDAGTREISKSDIAMDGWIGAGKHSETLANVNLANWLGKGYWDEETGEYVQGDTYGNMVDGWKSIVTEPTNYLPSPGIKAKFKSLKSLDDWHTFRGENKGVFTKQNYGGSSSAAGSARSEAFKKFNPAEAEMGVDSKTVPSKDDEDD